MYQRHGIHTLIHVCIRGNCTLYLGFSTLIWDSIHSRQLSGKEHVQKAKNPGFNFSPGGIIIMSIFPLCLAPFLIENILSLHIGKIESFYQMFCGLLL